MAKRKKRGLIALLALAGVGGLMAAAGTAKAAGGGGGEPYTGPGPNWPPNRRPTGPAAGATPTGSTSRPGRVESWDLWIAPDCSDVVEGDTWRLATAVPAIEAWRDAGLPAIDSGGELSGNPETSPERVVREILGPYAPLCIDAWPWRDVQFSENPPPEQEDFTNYGEYLAAFEEWNTNLSSSRQAAAKKFPKLAQLIGELTELVVVSRSEANA